MDRLFAAQGAADLQLGLDLALEYGKKRKLVVYSVMRRGSI